MWIGLGVLAVPVVLGAAMGLHAATDDDSGGGGGGGGDGSGGCSEPTFTVDVKTFTDEPVDPLDPTLGLFDVSLEGTVTMTGEHPVKVTSIVVPMTSSPSALVYGNLDDDPLLAPGETAPFSGSGPVELTGSPAVIPDDSSAEVGWEYEDLQDGVNC